MDTMISMDTVLSNDLMQAFAKRVGSYDRENRFFKEDFEDLRKAGYLTMNVPKEFGGQGMSLAEVCKRQRRLAVARGSGGWTGARPRRSGLA